jgi:circadian clock protein KaiC
MERIKTGILELDKMLGGGFMPGDAVLIAGSAGSGKTTLALQYLVNGVTQFGDRGIYVTFEELPNQIYRDAKSFGWDLRKLEEENKFRLICTSPNLLMQAEGGENILDESIKEIQPQRIVVDSLSHLQMYLPESELRKETYRLIMYLKTKRLSSVFTWESPQIVGQSLSVTEAGMSFLVDGIVLLRYVEIESALRKALIILKLRGSDHSKELREFVITSQGIKVAAPFTQYEGIVTGPPKKLMTNGFMQASNQR